MHELLFNNAIVELNFSAVEKKEKVLNGSVRASCVECLFRLLYQGHAFFRFVFLFRM